MEIDKLAQDAAKAKAAHMSYGKWKAMHFKPVVKPIEKPKKIPEGMRACIHCGKIFKPANGKQKYCEPLCRVEAHDQDRRAYRREWERNKRLQKKMEAEKNGE